MKIEEQKRKAKANGDSPAYPVLEDLHEGEKWVGKSKPHAGLTKREYFAGLNMATFGAFIHNDNGNTLQSYNDYAIQVADDLLFQLAGEIENEG